MSAEDELKRARDALFAASRALTDAHRARLAGSTCKCGGHGGAHNTHAALLHACRLADRALQRAAIRFSAALVATHDGLAMSRIPQRIQDLGDLIEDPPLPVELQPEPIHMAHNAAYDLGLMANKLERAERYWSGRAAADALRLSAQQQLNGVWNDPRDVVKPVSDHADAVAYGTLGSVSWRNKLSQTAVETAPGQYQLEVSPTLGRLIAACKIVIDNLHKDGEVTADREGLERIRAMVELELELTRDPATEPQRATVTVEYAIANRWLVKALDEEVELR